MKLFEHVRNQQMKRYNSTYFLSILSSIRILMHIDSYHSSIAHIFEMDEHHFMMLSKTNSHIQKSALSRKAPLWFITQHQIVKINLSHSKCYITFVMAELAVKKSEMETDISQVKINLLKRPTHSYGDGADYDMMEGRHTVCDSSTKIDRVRSIWSRKKKKKNRN